MSDNEGQDIGYLFNNLLSTLSLEQVRSMVIIAATELAARQREQSPVKEHVDAGARIELLVTLEPPGTQTILVNSNDARYLLTAARVTGATIGERL